MNKPILIKPILNKQVLITATILTLFAILGGSLVAITERSTAQKIQDNDKQMLLNSLNTIVPVEEYDNDLTASTLTVAASQQLGTKEDSVIYIASKNKQPVAFIFNSVAPNGYNGRIDLLVGIYKDGKIAGTRVVKHRETPGLGDAIEARRSDWILGFNQLSLESLTEKQWKVKRDGGVFDQFTGATITPRAVVKSVHQTLIYYQANRDQLIAQATDLFNEGKK